MSLHPRRPLPACVRAWLPLLAGLHILAPTVGSAANYRARYRKVEEPKALKLRLYGMEAGVDVEQVREDTEFRNSGSRTTYERSYIAPSISLGAVGSIYHPNFIAFDLWGRGSYGTADQEYVTDGERTRTDELEDFEDFRGRVDILPGKPLSGNLHGLYGRNYRDYDFFTRSTVQSINFGAESVYRTPSLYTILNVTRIEERVLDTTVPSTTKQNLAGVNVQHQRRKGTSTFNYTVNQTEYTGATPDSRSSAIDHAVSVADHERLGPQERTDLHTDAGFNHREYVDAPEDQYRIGVNALTEYRPTLSTYVDGNYDRFETDDYTSDSINGRGELRHQLYESLFSTPYLHASDYQTRDARASGYTRRLGGGIQEAYRKQLSDEHTLQLDAAVGLDDVHQSGGSGRGVNERHTFPPPPATEAFLLELSGVRESTIVVTDAGGVQTFARGIDYEVFPRGSRTEIRRIPGGNIPQGATVLVSYGAADQGSGNYQNWTRALSFRLDLWEGFWGIYARSDASQNNAPPDLYAQEYSRFLSGTDVSWWQLHAGAEYEVYESTDSDYRTTRFFESAWLRPDSRSSLSLGFNQMYTDYMDQSRSERDYRYILAYRRALTRRFIASLDAGFDQRRGEGVDQDLVVVRPEIDYAIGQTTIEISYDYEHNLYLQNEERNKHRLNANLTRQF